MDDAVVVGIDSLEGEPGLLAIEAAVQQLLQGREGEVAVIHGLVVDPHLPAHEGLALRGKGRGIGQDVLLVRIGGDHVAAADDVLVLVHELEVDDTVVVGKDGLEGQPGLILVEVLAVLLHECIERIVGELALIHGGIPKTHLPAHKGLALGGEAGGSRGLKLDAGGGGDDIAAAQGHVLAVHIVHKGHMDGVVHSALTVQADHGGIRDNPLDVVVIQHNGHGGAVHTGVSLRIGVIRRHIGGGIEPDVVVITLDAQAVARHRVAAIQQAGGDGLVALGGAVHLQVQQKGLQLVIRGGDPADGDRDNIVINHQVALFRQLVAGRNPGRVNLGGLYAVGVGSHSHGVAVAHLLTGHLVHEADGDLLGVLLVDGNQFDRAIGDTKELSGLSIGESGTVGQFHAILGHPVDEFHVHRSGDAGGGDGEVSIVAVQGARGGHILEAVSPSAVTVIELQGDGLHNVLIDGVKVDRAVVLAQNRLQGVIGERPVGVQDLGAVQIGPVVEFFVLGRLDGGAGGSLLAVSAIVPHGELHCRLVVQPVAPGAVTVVELCGDAVLHSLIDGVDVQILVVIDIIIRSPVVNILNQSLIIESGDSCTIRSLPADELHPVRGSFFGLHSGRIQRGCRILGRYRLVNTAQGRLAIIGPEGDIDGIDLLLLGPLSNISGIFLYSVIHLRIPASEVPAVTVQITVKLRGGVAVQEVLVFLILEHSAAYTVLVGHGVLGLSHVGLVVVVGVIAPDGVDRCLVVGGDINSIDCGRRGIGLAVDRIGIGTRPADKDNGLPVHSLMGGLQGSIQLIAGGLGNADIHGRGVLTTDLTPVCVIGQLVRIGDRLLVSQGHSNHVSLGLQGLPGLAGHFLDIVSFPIIPLDLVIDLGDGGLKARVAGQPQPLGLGGGYLVRAHTGVLHRQGGGAELIGGHGERNGTVVLAVRSLVVQGSVAVQGDLEASRLLGIFLDLDLIGQGDALILLQALIVRPGNDAVLCLGIGAACCDGDILHQLHVGAQRVVDQTKDVLADLLEAVGQIFGVIGRIIVFLSSSGILSRQILEAVTLVSKADRIDLAVFLEGIGLLSGPHGQKKPVAGLAVGQDDHDAIICTVLQHFSAFHDASGQRGAVRGKPSGIFNLGNRSILTRRNPTIHDIRAIDVVAQAALHGFQGCQGDFPTALFSAAGIRIILPGNPSHRPGTVDHEYDVGLLGLDMLLVGCGGQGDLIGVIRQARCGLAQGDSRILLLLRLPAVDCIILVSWI